MKCVDIKTKNDEEITLYGVTEISKNRDWISIRTSDGNKKNIKRENIENIKVYTE